MTLNDDVRYYLIFDTNVLFQAYERKADFTSFSFNSTYENIIDMINQLDIYSQVVLVIPSVVWGELEQQIIEKHDELLSKYISTIKHKVFPEYSIKENPPIDYSEYIKTKIKEYKSDIQQGMSKVIEIQNASNSRFRSIIDRAFSKRPPFEGKDKKSDKGFKDALLWESILEFALNQPKSKIIYYSKDNAFGEFLFREFSEVVDKSSLFICKNENEVRLCLEAWAKDIDKYSYQPLEDYDENKEIIDWLNSKDFIKQIIEGDFDFIERGRLINSVSAHLININDIDECLSSNEEIRNYYIELTLRLMYIFKDGAETAEEIDVGLDVTVWDESIYMLKDAYTIDDE